MTDVQPLCGLILNLTPLTPSIAERVPFAPFRHTGVRWHAFVTSAVIHVVVLSLLHSSNELLGSLAPQTLTEAMLRPYRVEMLRLRIPDTLYVASSSAPAQPMRPRVAPKRTRGTSVSKPPTLAHNASAPRRRFELPPVPRIVESEQTLIQPNAVDRLLPLSARVPDVFFWAPPSRAAELRQFVPPGSRHPSLEPRRLDAPPRLDTPGPDPTKLGLAATRVLAPKLALGTREWHPFRAGQEGQFQDFVSPPSAPVRTSPAQGGAPSREVADSIPGDPVNVLAISGSRTPIREFVTIPAANQVGRTPGAAIGGALTGFDTQLPVEVALDQSGVGMGALNAQAGQVGAAGETGPSGPPALSAAGAKPRSPGIFDVVVHSTNPAGFGDSPGVLSGKPVYSVYLAVGAKRRWILQYCIPAADASPPHVSGAVVRLRAPARLVAPYPWITFRPPLSHKEGSYLMLHGLINAAGRFQNLRMIGVNDPAHSDEVLGALERWEFRPASSAGRAVRVEILLVIPGES